MGNDLLGLDQVNTEPGNEQVMVSDMGFNRCVPNVRGMVMDYSAIL